MFSKHTESWAFRKRILKHLIVTYMRNIFNVILNLLLYNI
jgi:hypothetical protein